MAAETTWVLMATVPLVLPAETVNVPGIEANAEPPLRIVRDTTASLDKACANVTFAVVVAPPTSELGVNVKEVRPFGVTVSDPVLLTPLAAADT